MLNKKIALPVIFALTAPLGAQASISVDGDISDWISMPVENNWNSTTPQVDGGEEWDPLRSTTSYVISDTSHDNSKLYQDTNGSENHSSTSSSGGQPYDAEALYMELQGTTLYMAIVTGLSPNNTKYSAGDIFFDLNGDIGTSGGNGYEYGLVVTDHDSNKSQELDFNDGNSWSAGELFALTDWNDGINSGSSGLHPVSGRTGTKVTGAETALVYNDNYVNGIGPYDYANSNNNYTENDHYIIEASISLVDSSGNYNAFGNSLIASLATGANDINVHWNPLCNNDWIQFTGKLVDNRVPEPMPLALMAIGFIGMVARKKYIKV